MSSHESSFSDPWIITSFFRIPHNLFSYSLLDCEFFFSKSDTQRKQLLTSWNKPTNCQKQDEQNFKCLKVFNFCFPFRPLWPFCLWTVFLSRHQKTCLCYVTRMTKTDLMDKHPYCQSVHELEGTDLSCIIHTNISMERTTFNSLVT